MQSALDNIVRACESFTSKKFNKASWFSKVKLELVICSLLVRRLIAVLSFDFSSFTATTKAKCATADSGFVSTAFQKFSAASWYRPIFIFKIPSYKFASNCFGFKFKQWLKALMLSFESPRSSTDLAILNQHQACPSTLLFFKWSSSCLKFVPTDSA